VEWIIYFAIGIVVNILSTFYTKSVATKKAFSASNTAFLIDLLHCLFFCSILASLYDGGGITLITTLKVAVYAGGAWTGTFLAMLDYKKYIRKVLKN
jgi:hypothetical protein